MTKKNHKAAILTVLEYIDSHRDSDLNLDLLCNVAHISKFHFHRIFKEYMGLSLGVYSKLKRLESGMWKLVYTDDTTLSIALSSGYTNHSAFTRAFTKELSSARLGGFSDKRYILHI